MAVQYSDTVRNNKLDSIETSVGTSPKLRVLTGAAPANCAAAETGTLLAEIALPADWMNAAATGSKTKLGTWSTAAVAGGVAGYFRIVDTAGTTCHMQGTVGQGSGDLSLDNTNIANGQTFTINTFTINENNG